MGQVIYKPGLTSHSLKPLVAPSFQSHLSVNMFFGSSATLIVHRTYFAKH